MQFKFSELVQESPDIVSAALGVSAVTQLTGNDIGKAVKLGADDNYVLCANGDDIGGTLESVNPDTVNDGFAFGSVNKKGRRVATVDAAELNALVVGESVTAGTQSAIDTVGGLVCTGTPGAIIQWVVVSILTGTGVAGDTVLIEKV